MIPTTIRRPAEIILGFLFVLAACSGNGDNPTAATDTTIETGARSTSTTIESAVPTETQPPASGASEPRYATQDATVLFDQRSVHRFDIDLDDEALDQLDDDPAAEEYVEGSLTFDGETLEQVGVRYKGSVGAFLGCTEGPNPLQPSGAKTCPKLSIKLKINWAGTDTEFYGQRKIQLHSMNNDPSLIRERLGYLLFAEAGVPAPRASHARVVINGDFIGLFALVEQIDGRFTRDRFDDGSGNLYKEVWPFTDTGEVRSADALFDGLKTNEDDDPSAEIIQSFAREILATQATTDESAARRILTERTDLDSFVAYAVVDRAINHDDGPFHWYCPSSCEPHNYYLYEEPASGKIHVIPWDLDNALRNWTPNDTNPIAAFTKIADSFGETSNDCLPFPFGPLNVPQRSAACDPLVATWALLVDEFERTDAAFRSGPFSIDNVSVLVQSWRAQIAPYVAEAAAADPTAPSVESWNAAVDQLLADIAAEPSR